MSIKTELEQKLINHLNDLISHVCELDLDNTDRRLVIQIEDTMHNAEKLIKNVTKDIKTYNGWTNWDTWESYNMLSSNEYVYTECERDNSIDNLEFNLLKVLDTMSVDIEHIMFSRVNWTELQDAFKRGN